MAGFFRTPPRQVEFPDEAAEIRHLQDREANLLAQFADMLKLHEFVKQRMTPEAVKKVQRGAAALRKRLRGREDTTRLVIAQQLLVDEIRRFHRRTIGPLDLLPWPRELGGTGLRRKRKTREERG